MTNEGAGRKGEEGSKKPAAAAGKITKGRQKIEIKQLEKKNNLHVTFSKRRKGLFKKASELCILAGANIGIVVLSPSPREKPFCFGHPNIDKVLDKYVAENPTPVADDDDDQGGVTSSDLKEFEELNKKFEESVEMLETEKKKAEEIKNNNGGGKFWWDEADIESMGLEELEIYVQKMEQLKKKVIIRANALAMANVMETSALSGLAQNPYDFPGLQ